MKIVFSHRGYLFLAVSVILLACLIWQISQLWVVRSYFSKGETYPKANVLDINVGNLSSEKLATKLNELKSEFETRKVTLTNGSDEWTFDLNKLGVTFDVKTTSQTIWKINSLSLLDKYRLLTSSVGASIEPTVTINDNKCVDSLSIVSIPQVDSKDATLSFGEKLTIIPDEIGKKFSASLTCRELPKRLAKNMLTADVYLDDIKANINKSDLESKLSKIQAIVGESLLLQSGSYKLQLTSKQLLELLEISKDASGVQVGWSLTKLDGLINGIADEVNTYSSGPALGGCQYLVSSGGNWLDKEATKKIFTDLETAKLRTYTLTISYHNPVVGERTPVKYGNNGTVYLTFDDGLQYGNQIMNYASCYGIKVTFFEIGSRASTDAASLRRAIAEGHAVQSHGYEHAAYDYGKKDLAWQENDMKQSVDAITNVTGVRPTYFRPPGGNRSNDTYTAASDNGLKLILWGVSSADTVASFGSDTICSNVLAGAFSGASVLMHSSKQATASAVPCIIEGLAARGYNMQALR